jgi:hypothetical protein
MGDKSAYAQLTPTIKSSYLTSIADYSSESSESELEEETLAVAGNSSKRKTFNWTLAAVHHCVSFMYQKKRSEMLHIMQKTRKLEQQTIDLECLSAAGYHMADTTWRSMNKEIIRVAKLAKDTNEFLFKNLKLGANKLSNITAKKLMVSSFIYLFLSY